MILVTAATGSIGRHAVRQLRERSADFKAMVRNPDRGESLECPYVVADFDAPETLRAALKGVDRVLLNGAVDEAMIRQQIALLDVAKVAGVEYVVRISAIGASPTDDRIINRWHAQIDAYLQASGIGWTVLRPTFFMQNLLFNASTVRDDGRLFGGFRNGRLAMIDCSDIAACAESLLARPRCFGAAIELTGGEALSFAEVAEKLSARLGRSVSYVDRPVSELVASMKARAMHPSIAESFGKMMESFANGGASATTSGVRDLTGRAPRTLDDFLDETLESFR